jgi:hypothetical protein
MTAGAALFCSLPDGLAFTMAAGTIPGSVCRTESPITIVPPVASKRQIKTRSRFGPPTSSQGNQTL